MPNVKICGFSTPEAASLKGVVNLVMERLGLTNDAITSIIPMEAVSCDKAQTPKPYICVCSTNRDEIFSIIKALGRAGLKVDVEWLVLDGFVEVGKLASFSPPT
ncbi:MAG: hypothetical protein AAB738_02780 [Patescibacteria group bacterium]